MGVAVVETMPGTIFSPIIVAAVFGQKTLSAGLANSRVSSALPTGILISRVMLSRMRGSCNQLEILKRIIRLLLIQMMDKFCFQQRASKVFTHYQTMLGNITHIPLFERIGMVGTQKVNIAILRDKATATPSCIVRTTGLMPSDIAATTLLETRQVLPARHEGLGTTASANKGCHVNIIIRLRREKQGVGEIAGFMA